MDTIIIAQNDLDKLEGDEFIFENLKENPHLFPLYLLRHFRRKYSKDTILEKEQSYFYSRKSVFCKNSDHLFPQKNQSWFIATTRWEHVTFYFQIGRNGFNPFTNDQELAEGLVAYIKIEVFARKLSISLDFSGYYDLPILFYMSKIGEEITVEMEKYGLST